jgi:crotonobetainyl-CoA:carnitine CoA-transferase CaiB-like acyl-CoA transferase
MTISGLGLIRTLYTDLDADERAHQVSLRIHGVYEANDGYIVIRAIGEEAVNSVARVIGVDPSDITPNSDSMKTWFKKRKRSEISRLLSDKVPCAPVLTDLELIGDENVRSRNMVIELPHPEGFTYRSVATGIKFSETPVSVRAMPPSLGADSVDILKRLGYSDLEIKKLIEDEVTQNP